MIFLALVIALLTHGGAVGDFFEADEIGCTTDQECADKFCPPPADTEDCDL